MIGLDWLILDWCIGSFWETNMERAYHTSKTLKVNYVHHASFWWNHYIIHINRPKKLSQVSPNWPILFQTYRFFKSYNMIHIGDKIRIVSTCSSLKFRDVGGKNDQNCHQQGQTKFRTFRLQYPSPTSVKSVLFHRVFPTFRKNQKIFLRKAKQCQKKWIRFLREIFIKTNFGENNLNCQFSPAYYANGFAIRIHHFRQFW